MNRSNYSCEIDDNWQYIKHTGAVKSAIRGKRGQAFLREMAAALDGMEKKELIVDSLAKDGSYCALGVVGHCRGQDAEMANIDPEDYQRIAEFFCIAIALAREIMYENDYCQRLSNSDRWAYMRDWVSRNLKKASTTE